MFFKKSEPKKRSSCVILTIGALATVGLISVTKCGKEMLRKVKGKISNMISGICMTKGDGSDTEN